MANEIIVTQVNPTTFEQQQISQADENLMTVLTLDGKFDQFADTVELYYYDVNQQLLGSVYDYRDWIGYQTTNPAGTNYLEDLTIDPALDATQVGYYNGTVYGVYRFVKNELGTSNTNTFYISEISSDRTEVTLTSQQVDFPYSQSVAEFKTKLDSTNYFQEFYLNFGDNFQVVAVNIRTVPKGIQIKLYEPLTTLAPLKATCWVQTEVADTVAYSVTFNQEVIVPSTTQFIAGPNLNLKVNQKIGNTTVYQNENQIFANGAFLTPQVDSILNEAGIEINIDYSDFANFVHFSTATQRIYNYYNKVEYLNELAAATASITVGGLSTSTLYASQSADVIKNFDGYEYYLYFNQNLTSSAYLQNTWMGTPGWEGTGMLGTASRYDEENQDNLLLSVPMFIREDSANDPYLLFVEMIGQYFDNLYLYTKAISDKFNNDNRLQYGIAPELVAEVLRGFGVKLYQNNFTVDDLYTALIGLNATGSIPFQTIQTGSLAFGQQYINQIVSASNAQIPFTEINQSTYKRIYHNLPLLVKKKGTLAGLQQLINTFGIPNTILRIYEFGGKDKDKNTWDYWQNTFSYCLTGSSATASMTSQFQLSTGWNATNNVPGLTSFKFKTIDSSSVQTIWKTDFCRIDLIPHQPSVAPGTYLGQPLDPYYNYATASLYIGTTDKTDLFLPFYNGYWWTIGAAADLNTNEYTLLGGATTFNGTDGNTVNYYSQSKVTTLDTGWSNSTLQFIQVTGSLQESRLYSNVAATSSFKDFIVNLDSTENWQYLAFRGALGGELFTGSISIHPLQNTASFITNTSNFTVDGFYTGSRVTVFYDQPAVGIKNIVSQKIQITGSQAYGDVLSQYITLEQPVRNYTEAVNYLEVGFSPTNEVNEEINNQLGFFNIGEYIGDPALQWENTYSYPALDYLRNEYFSQYLSNYNFTDYIRLITFFDNSLFKMVKDFIPAKSGAATGVIIKQNQLERNRQRPPVAEWQNETYSGSVKSFPLDYETGSLVVASGGPGGSVNDLQTSEQAWSGSILTKAGEVTFVESSRYEFFNGEYSGSNLQVEDGNLGPNPMLAPEYVLSIPETQNFTATAIEGYEMYPGSQFPFTTLVYPCATFDTTTATFNPIYEVVTDMVIALTASIYLDAGEGFVLGLVEGIGGDETLILNSGWQYAPLVGSNDVNFAWPINNLQTRPGYYYYPVIGFEFAINSSASLNSGTTWTAVVDNLSTTSTYYLDPTVFTQQNFIGNLAEFTEYNAILNNVYSNRVSNRFYNVDYTNGILYPTNFNSIMSGSAIYAQVQDSNYSYSSSWQRNRYDGVKLTGQKVNEYTAGDTTYGKQPVVNQETAYMLYYDWAGGTLAERQGSANYHIQYLIDETGTLYKPEYSSSFYYNVEQAFGANIPVNVTVYNNSTNVATAVETTVYRPLNRLATILYSSTGSVGNDYLLSGSYGTIGFSASAELLPSVNFLRAQGTNLDIGNGLFTCSFQTVTQDNQIGLNRSTYIYTVPTGSAPLRYFIAGSTTVNAAGSALTGDALIGIFHNGNLIADSGVVSIAAGGLAIVTATFGDLVLYPGDTIQLQLALIGFTPNSIDTANVFQIEPETPFTGNVNRPYWTVGASSRNVLTASAALVDWYGGGYAQVPIAGSGFDNPLPFAVQRFDQIRFEGKESLVYTVATSSFDRTNKTVSVTLHAPVPVGIDINNFSIRRLISDPGFVLLNYQQGKGPGFIIPKYPSPLLQQNISKIIKDFAEKNLI